MTTPSPRPRVLLCDSIASSGEAMLKHHFDVVVRSEVSEAELLDMIKNFHIRYNEYRASIEIRTLNILAGHLPAKVRRHAEEWSEMHQDELLEMWESKDFHSIEPLV